MPTMILLLLFGNLSYIHRYILRCCLVMWLHPRLQLAAVFYVWLCFKPTFILVGPINSCSQTCGLTKVGKGSCKATSLLIFLSSAVENLHCSSEQWRVSPLFRPDRVWSGSKLNALNWVRPSKIIKKIIFYFCNCVLFEKLVFNITVQS